MKFKQLKAGMTGVLAATMVVTLTPVHAENEADVIKDESVYAFLNGDGSVKDITVSDWLHSDNGFNNYIDASNLQDVENLKSTDKVKTSTNGYVWDSKEDNIYYQGKGTKQLPVSADVSYVLDGKKYTVDELAGKSGHLKITIRLTNNEKMMQNIDGINRPIYIPFVSVAMVMFKGSDSNNIKSSIGTVQTDSTNKIVAAVMLPGMKDSFGNLLDGKMSELKTFMNDEMVVEADVTDFSTPVIMIASSTDTEEVKETLDTKDLDKAKDDLDKLQDATAQLIDGAKRLNEGTNTLVDGTNKLSDGTNQLADGAAQLNNGLGTLNSKSKDLIAATDTLANAILGTVNESLKEAGLEPVDYSNYNEKLTEYAGITPEMLNTAKETIRKQAEKTGTKLDDDGLNRLLYAAATLEGADQLTVEQQILKAAEPLKNAAMIKAKFEAASKALADNNGDALKIQQVNNVFDNNQIKLEGIISKVVEQAKLNNAPITNEEAELLVVYACLEQEYTDFAGFENHLKELAEKLKQTTKIKEDINNIESGMAKQQVAAALGTDENLQKVYDKAYSQILITSKQQNNPLDPKSAELALVYGAMYGTGDTIQQRVESVAQTLANASAVEALLTPSYKALLNNEELKKISELDSFDTATLYNMAVELLSDKMVADSQNTLSKSEAVNKAKYILNLASEGANNKDELVANVLNVSEKLKKENEEAAKGYQNPTIKSKCDLLAGFKKLTNPGLTGEMLYDSIIQAMTDENLPEHLPESTAKLLLYQQCKKMGVLTFENGLKQSAQTLGAKVNAGMDDPTVKAVFTNVSTELNNAQLKPADVLKVVAYKNASKKSSEEVQADLMQAKEVSARLESEEFKNALANPIALDQFKVAAYNQVIEQLVENAKPVFAMLKIDEANQREFIEKAIAYVIQTNGALEAQNADTLKEKISKLLLNPDLLEASRKALLEGTTNNEQVVKVLSLLSAEQAYAGAKAQVATSLAEKGVDPSVCNADQLIAFALMNHEGNVNHIEELEPIFEKAGAQLNIALAEGMKTDAASSEQGKAAIHGLLMKALKEQGVKDKFEQARASLANIQKFRNEGVIAYTNGVAQAYEGSKKLVDGSNKVKDGANQLKDGSNKLRDGSKELYDGLVKYNDEGISKLTGKGTEIATAEKIANVMKATGERRTSYTNYSGISDGTTGKVRFIYKIDSVTAPDQVRTPKVDTERKDPTRVDDGLNFWQRFIRLFTGK